ncbi:putative serine protease HtrA [Thalassoglobus neptunius]|uniref:Putative serine protease HtrA n=1 Tax=Thalassoglobus neptunius TaxID=1938619 RepID=A0A5C5WGM7_9PLAN|nr:transglutaminase family protein [Thalassoglobus neptunius]TWT49810.1 putative serine protease HtrA [Thalassoglobus neptunius]
MNQLVQRFMWGILIGVTSTLNAQDPVTFNEVPLEVSQVDNENFLQTVRRSQESTVVVEMLGRDGDPLGIGTGFVVRSDGLIATNLHVVGEARPIRVRLYDEREFQVTSIHATDKSRDVALIKIDATDLTPLPLAEPGSLEQGEVIFALGNPQGLEHSVVTGVVSGFRDGVDEMKLIQLAIPIEQGNSGGPLLDMDGRVHGMLTLKSRLTDNLGYAVPIDAVHDLLESPNPVLMEQWLTIGALNPEQWEPQGTSVNWRQRAGEIHVSGQGDGFGGRALCLHRADLPELPFEVAVDVRVHEEDGAAGLAFHSDGNDIHYGFYPSSGVLRLTRFDGPTVYSWNVLQDQKTVHWTPNSWNKIKVRIEEDRLSCFCNDELIFEQMHPQLQSGKIGLVKFRHTTASFKRFRFGSELPDERPSPEVLARVNSLANEIPISRPIPIDFVREQTDLDMVGQKAFHSAAKNLEAQAQQLRVLAREIHEEQTRQELVAKLEASPPELIEAALLIARLENPELNVEEYRQTVDALAQRFLDSIPEDLPPAEILDAFHEFLFEKNGFHGSRTNYYSASNSYLNEVIDDREGLPLTLSILYLELAQRVGLTASGIGLPGHFLVRVDLPDEQKYIDVFDKGTVLTEMMCRRLVRETTGLPWNASYLDPQDATSIIKRMLRNLIGIANSESDLEAALRYTRTVLAIDPNSVEDRLYKAVLCYNTERWDEGLEEVRKVLQEQPPEIELGRVRELQDAILERQRESESGSD